MPQQILASKYIVQEEIARGGMGVIYKALDRTLNRVVAIKMIHAHLSGDSSFVERFLREARAMARLQHDNIVTIYAVEEDQGTQLLVMEYFQGKNLRALTKNQPRLPLRDVVSITHQLASALAFAHAHGIIHRDIKPANVMVDARGKAKLTDFGIAAALDEASITSTGQVIGTPEYMSPEQACGTKLDGRSDLYSVGILLYEMLTGKTPYADASKTSILGKLAFDKQELQLVFPSDVPSLLQGVVRDLLRRQPDERIPDADTLASQLHEILYTLPASPAVPTSSESDATVLVSAPPTAKVPDKVEPELPTVLASGGHIEARVEPSTATKSTRFPPPTAAPRPPATSHLEETTILPPQPRTSVDSVKPSTSAAPALPPSPPPQSSFRLMTLIGGSLVVVALLVGLIYYIASGPESPRPDIPRKSPPPDDSKVISREARLKEREEIMSKLDELVRRFANRLQAERQTSECPTLKANLVEAYGKVEDSVRDVNMVRQELGREPLSAPARPPELDLPCEPLKPFPQPRPKPKSVPPPPALPQPQPPVQIPKPFPDVQLSSLLEKFKTAYENHDLAMIQSISRMSEDRLRNVQVMFANYETIRASIKDLVQTEQGASATLFLDSVTTAEGESVSLPPLARKFNLKIPRQGAEWEKISW